MIKIIPTDTCYGLAGSLNKSAFDEIYNLKWRESTKRLAIVVRDFDVLMQIAIATPRQIEILQKYPFPFSAILPRNPSYQFPEFLKTDNYNFISVRIWEKCLKKEVLEKLHFPFFLTSANLSGYPETTTFDEAKSFFPNLDGIDGGICGASPSNIFSFGENDELIFLRKNYE